MRASAAYRSEFSPDGRRGPASPSSRLRRHATTLRLYPLVVEAAQCLPAARVGAPLVVCEAAQFGRVLGNLLVDEVVAGGREIHEPRPVVRGANFVPQGRAVARGRALHHVGQPQRRVSLGRRLVCVEEGGALKHCEPPLLNLPQPKDSLGGLPRRLDHLRLAGGHPEECVTEALDLRRPLQARVAREEAVPQGRRRPAWLCHYSARLPVLDSLRQLALDEGSGHRRHRGAPGFEVLEEPVDAVLDPLAFVPDVGDAINLAVVGLQVDRLVREARPLHLLLEAWVISGDFLLDAVGDTLRLARGFSTPVDVEGGYPGGEKLAGGVRHGEVDGCLQEPPHPPMLPEAVNKVLGEDALQRVPGREIAEDASAEVVVILGLLVPEEGPLLDEEGDAVGVEATWAVGRLS